MGNKQDTQKLPVTYEVANPVPHVCKVAEVKTNTANVPEKHKRTMIDAFIKQYGIQTITGNNIEEKYVDVHYKIFILNEEVPATSPHIANILGMYHYNVTKNFELVLKYSLISCQMDNIARREYINNFNVYIATNFILRYAMKGRQFLNDENKKKLQLTLENLKEIIDITEVKECTVCLETKLMAIYICNCTKSNVCIECYKKLNNKCPICPYSVDHAIMT